MSTQQTAPQSPTVTQTGNGYQYVRCRSKDEDNTCYIHQLTAIADGADPCKVFGDGYQVEHILKLPRQFDAPQLDFADNLVVVPHWRHGERERVEPPFQTPEPPRPSNTPEWPFG